MTGRIEIAKASISRIKALIPADVDAEDFVHSVLDEALDHETIDEPVSMGIVGGLTARRDLSSAQRTAELFNDVDELCGRQEGIPDLGLIEWLLRPALLLKDGEFQVPSAGPWNGLSAKTARLISRSVCRIDILVENSARIHLGTGFVIGRDHHSAPVIATNAHVIDAAQAKFGWPHNMEIKLVSDFFREVNSLSDGLLFLSSEFRVHPSHDLALVGMFDSEGAEDIVSLALASDVSTPVDSLQLGLIGHPSFNSDIDPLPKLYGFGESFGVKRFSPGILRGIEDRYWRMANVEVALHDACTLSGSSGSCVFDIDSGNILAIHFGGWPLPAKSVTVGGVNTVASLFESNGAVPLWTLREDPFFDGTALSWL